MTDDSQNRPKPQRLPTFEGVHQPDPAAYRELIGRLADSADRADSGADLLAEAVQSLRNILSFLQHDPVSAAAVLPGPLTVLHNVLHDLQQGARPELLERSRPGATNLSNRDLARAYIASALDLLMRHGEPAADAAAWIVQTCATLGIQHQGEPIQAQRVKRWRRDLASEQGAAADAVEIFKRGRRRELRGLTARDWALVILQFVAKNYNEPKSRGPPQFPGE